MKAALLGIAVVFGASTAGAQAAWPVILKNPTVTVAFDIANAQRNEDGSYLTRTRWDYAKLHALESKRPYMSMTQSSLIRCTPVRIKRLNEAFYSANGSVVREGSTPSPRTVQYMTWDRLRTGSDASKAYNAACALLKKRDKQS